MRASCIRIALLTVLLAAPARLWAAEFVEVATDFAYTEEEAKWERMSTKTSLHLKDNVEPLENMVDNYFKEHPAAAHALGGRKIIVRYIRRPGDVKLVIEVPNGTRSTLTSAQDFSFYRNGIGAKLTEALDRATEFARLTPVEVDAELRWMREQLQEGLASHHVDDVKVVEDLLAKIDAIKPPDAKTGFIFKKAVSPEKWMTANFDMMVEIRGSAMKWGQELGFSVISYEDKLMADRAQYYGFLKNATNAEGALAEKVWDHIEGDTLRDTLRKHGAALRIEFKRPAWVIQPTADAPGRALVKAEVTVLRADGATQTIEVAAKVNTKGPLGGLMAGDEWLDRFSAQFQHDVGDSFVEIDQFLAHPQRVDVGPETRSRVAESGAVAAADDTCDEAVGKVMRVMEH